MVNLIEGLPTEAKNESAFNVKDFVDKLKSTLWKEIVPNVSFGQENDEAKKSLLVFYNVAKSILDVVSSGVSLDCGKGASSRDEALAEFQKSKDVGDFIRVMEARGRGVSWGYTDLEPLKVAKASLLLDMKLRDGAEKFLELGDSAFTIPSPCVFQDLEVRRVKGKSRKASLKGKLAAKVQRTLVYKSFFWGGRKGYGRLSETEYSYITHVCSPKAVGLEHFDRVDAFNKRARQEFLLQTGRVDMPSALISFQDKQTA